MALLEFEFFGGVKSARVKLQAHAGIEVTGQLFAAGQMARLDQGGLHCDVRSGSGEAFVKRADAVPGLETNVPELANQCFDFGADF